MCVCVWEGGGEEGERLNKNARQVMSVHETSVAKQCLQLTTHYNTQVEMEKCHCCKRNFSHWSSPHSRDMPKKFNLVRHTVFSRRMRMVCM